MMHVQFRRRWSVLLAAALLAACDKDPTRPPAEALTVSLLTDSIIPIQGPIRLKLSGPIDSAASLSSANFVVTNTCTGLPVPGVLRLAGDTLTFSPSQALPFLTSLSVRVQNLLSPSGQQLRTPTIFTMRTQNPPVPDVSWQALNTPTNDAISGVSFASRQVGYLSTLTGGVYRTFDGGASFAAQFKNANINNMRDILALSDSDVYVAATVQVDSVTYNASLLHSTNAATTFASPFSRGNSTFFTLSAHRTAGQAPVFLFGGNDGASLAVFRYDAAKDSASEFGPVGGQNFGQAAALSTDGSSAAAVGFTANATFTVTSGIAYRSTDGGRSFTAVTLPAGTHALNGLAFSDGHTAYLLGDTSTVLRLDATTGTVTALGAAQGILQTETDTVTGGVIVYSYRDAAFAPDDPSIGWIVGSATRRVTGQPDVRRGVILITRDGGQTWTRQAVLGVGENGLGFPALRVVSALSKDFAVVGGDNGFAAARKSNTQNLATVCSFPGQ